jgi:hypothetical protein
MDWIIFYSIIGAPMVSFADSSVGDNVKLQGL